MARSKATKASTGPTAAAVREDGWTNLLTGMGTRVDRTQLTRMGAVQPLDRAQLAAIYRCDGIGRKIVDLVPQEGTREWIDVEGDPSGELAYALDEIHAKQRCRDLWRWARLYGGAVMVMGIDDGGTFEMPLNEASIRRVVFLRVYDRHQVSWTDQDLDPDPESESYGEPQIYTVQPYSGGAPYRVHRSRLIVMQGAAIPERDRIRNNGWGDSVLLPVYEALRNMGTGYNAAANILGDFVQTVLSVTNLSDLIASGREDLIRKRLHLIDLSRSVLNTILLDAEEQYSKQASSVAGLGDVLDRLGALISGITGIPQTKLFGRSPAGLNATGESDVRNWYDEVKDEQEDKLLPVLNRLKDLIVASREGPWRGREPAEGLTICFRPLWQMTQEQEAAYRLNVAQADKIYLETGVLDPSEVALSRFGGDTYSAETQIDVASRQMEAPLSSSETAEMEAAARAAALAQAQQSQPDPAEDAGAEQEQAG